MPPGSRPPSLADVLGPQIARDHFARVSETQAKIIDLQNRLRGMSIVEAIKDLLRNPPSIYGAVLPQSDYESVKLVLDLLAFKKLGDAEFREILIYLDQAALSPAARDYLAHYVEVTLTGPFVYPGDVEKLVGKPPFGDHHCAKIVQYTIPTIGKAATWRQGIKVRGNGRRIPKGTAIATFVDGFYPNEEHGNHVAFYHSQTENELTVIDQWKGKETITYNNLPYRGKNPDGTYEWPSDNGDAFYVIMHGTW